MTVRGVTKPVTWDVNAKFGPQDVTGLATTSFTLADFNIAKPIVGAVLSIDDKMTFELDFKATRAAG
jgi:polyisoprenoid-binding protein YceI